MADETVGRLHAWLADHENELLQNFRSLLNIPSLKADPEPNAPYGAANRKALDFMLALANESGMVTVDMEGHCGWAEFGSGEAQVASFGHLDVVPVGDGWAHDPFGAVIEDGYVYARGAVDDKGPTIASFYACRAIQAVVGDPGARLRQWFGCDEESGFGCLHHYTKTEAAPTFGVAPDSGWPLYHAEKGIANLHVEVVPPSGELTLLEVSGGQRGNIVMDSCTARFRANRKVVGPLLAELWDKNVVFRWEGEDLVLKASGKAAHGSTPHLGDNAAARVFRASREIAPPLERYAFEDLLSMIHPGGEGLGITGADAESGALTNNLGVIGMNAGKVRMMFNVRYPVTWSAQEVPGRCEAGLKKLQHLEAKLVESSDSRPLYFPLDHPLVATIVDVVEAETGQRKEPGAMGGGTYARAIGNTVSIGTGWAGDGAAHETDERLAIESLHKMSRIYAHILWKLLQAARASA
ncbi:MAG: Sapep family Mn(2+)-dependent dipeptidase [Fimbriimonadaceae bacterium]|nr:Sapep family Mn(2+)-dependent dipeptidase [Fimbriimonadaceae bacterium]QYK56941.1 MAG: Sapep family Mn(2+)-dependent dipeptidase [Fimbriimonadaceae bacterium]